MLLDLNCKVVDLYDAPVLTHDGKQVTLGFAVINALSVANGMPVQEKLRAADLAEKMVKKSEFDATVEEIVFLKQIVGNAYPAVFVKRLYEMLDPKAKKG